MKTRREPTGRPLQETEIDVYDQLNLFFDEIDTPKEGMQCSYLVFRVSETEEGLSTTSAVVSPAMPTKCNPVDMLKTLPIHMISVIKSNEPLSVKMSEMVHDTMNAKQAFEALKDKGDEDLVDAFVDIMGRMASGEISQEEGEAERDRAILKTIR